ncbi:MAG: restriction endonuclease subunit S [Acidobacteriota bacterium]
MEFFKEKDFKNTKIGEVPKDWSVDILDEYAIIKGRIGWRGLKSSEYTKEGPYLIANTHIPKNRVEWEKCDHLSRYRYEESPEIQLKVRDVIMSKDGTIGQVAYIDYLPGEATLNSTMLLLRSKNKDLCSHYLYYFLQGFQFRKFLNQKTAGGQIPHIFQRDMKKLLLTLPERKEQRQIATILSRVDDAIQKTDEIIQKTQLLKKGLMQELLTKGIGHKEFKYSEELGCEIPKEWDALKIGDIFSLEYGKGLTERQRDDGRFPVFGSNGIVGYHSEYIVNGPGLIVGRKGTIGAISWSDKNFWPIDTTYYVKLKKETDLKWLFFKLISMKLAELNMATGTPGLNRDLVYSEKISFPPVPEQHQIASILSNVDDQIETERRTKEELEKLKKGLMQILLTGKVRVKVN